jgi:hypothetical protein
MDNQSLIPKKELEGTDSDKEEAVLNQIYVQELMEKIRKKVNENDPAFIRTLKSLLLEEEVKNDNQIE